MEIDTDIFLKAIWVNSPTDVFAGGRNDAAGQRGEIWRYNGSSWGKMRNTPSSVNSIWGTDADHVIAVAHDQIYHYNESSGGGWLLGHTDSEVLHCLWGISYIEAYAGGEYGRLLEWNGTKEEQQWYEVDSGTTAWLAGIWGESYNDFFAVGRPNSGNHEGVIRRCVYGEWDSIDNNASDYLKGVWGTSSHNVYTVGYMGNIWHSSGGGSWTDMSWSAPVDFYDVWGNSSSNIFVVGEGGTILQYNGSAWTEMESPTNKELRRIHGTSSGKDIFIVGKDGTILHHHEE